MATSSPAATTTTVVSSRMTPSITTTPSARAPPITVSRKLVSERNVPRFSIAQELRARINSREEWEYYSARVICGVRGPDNSVYTTQMITPPTRTQQQWYTPADNLDAINEISDGTSAASPESSGDERNQGGENDRESEHVASDLTRRENGE